MSAWRALDYGDVHHFAVERGGAAPYGRRFFERLYLSARAVYLLGGRGIHFVDSRYLRGVDGEPPPKADAARRAGVFAQPVRIPKAKYGVSSAKTPAARAATAMTLRG